MLPRGDWKWKTALAVFAIAAGGVALWPLPDPPPPPEAPSGKSAPDNNMLIYTIQDGDTAESIARLFVVRLEDLLAVNHVPPSGDFESGQRIQIPPADGL